MRWPTKQEVVCGAVILSSCLILGVMVTGVRVTELHRLLPGPAKDLQSNVQEEISKDVLLNDFKTKLKDLQTAGLWKANPPVQPCSRTGGSLPCNDTACSRRPYQEYEARLHSVLKPVERVNTTLRDHIMDLMKVKTPVRRVVIATGASSDHFLESQGLVRSLHQNVFPELNNYTFVYYDLGLKPEQIEQLKKHCQCEVRRYPVEKMPTIHKTLRCYTWKPFIIQANIHFADILIWADASIRFSKSIIGPLLKDVNIKGAIMGLDSPVYSVADHVQKTTFDHFGEQTCAFAQVGEMAATFLAFKNERLVRQAILKPWIACALDSKCMCPSNPEKLIVCHTNIRKYNKCHRFDQAALNIILAKLFWGNGRSFTPSRKYFDIRKEDRVHYFDKLGK
ncbi:uncharacterized protein LOC124286907 isoform X2 [Haliotis rubra]|uniref:uncharacterized protein LOC124286094 isoform X2 n=1 Tax=Haliotis rubra TaxID=36100 RepID=UPI001EE6160D|nr:uncharacterized protein LOC124286094 isoform X2 [Haliotis rubra]XP_046579309.1 uncharacterized protein LOC124286907 isoform X2 [Haliotis rubra]